MPNMKNAEKAVLVNAKKEVNNTFFLSSMKNAIKKVEKAILAKDKTKANDALKAAVKKIDKAAAKKVTSKNAVARNKARLSKKVNEME
jgi:small subunit ribosomal protein S20